MTNPRKFSEKIALHNQKQAEETAAFERIMQEVSVTRVISNPPAPNANHLQPHPQGFLRPYLGGSLPNVNQIAANPHMAFYPPSGYDDSKPMIKHSSRMDSRMRPYAFSHRRPLPLELSRNRMIPLDGHPSQHPNSYLSPPPESSWRRTNSDSALHKSVMNPAVQDPFSSNPPLHNQARHESFENSHGTASLMYKTLMDNKRFSSQGQISNRLKSSDAQSISHVSATDAGAMRAPSNQTAAYKSNGSVSNLPASIGLGLSHVSPIGNNTGSLPDLTNLHIPTPLINPIDCEDLPSAPQQQGGNIHPPSLYNQNRNPSNAMPGHLSGGSRAPGSPNRSRRNAHNGPSPLVYGSSEDGRRMKASNLGSTKMPPAKPELNSPPATVPYPRGHSGWPQLSSDHPTSPTYGSLVSPPGSERSEFTTGNNPTLSEAYYSGDVSSLQPLQYQFEQFHVVSDANNSQHHSVAPPVYSALATLNEDGLYDQGSLGYGAYQKHERILNNNKIPDIVFTGVDDANKPGSGLFGGNVLSSLDMGDFPCSDMKANQYMEELQMLDEPNIIHDPAIDDQLRLDSM